MNVALKKIKIREEMSEETTAFTAEIFINNKKSGYARNSGCGGCTDYYPYLGFREVFEEAELYFKSLPKIVYPADVYPEFTVESNFENWIDFQVNLKIKENIEKKLINDCKKFICYKCDGGYKMLGWKNARIDEMLSTEIGKKKIQSTVDKLKNEGEVILNTNLIGINL